MTLLLLHKVVNWQVFTITIVDLLLQFNFKCPSLFVQF